MTISKELKPYFDARHEVTVSENKLIDIVFDILYRSEIGYKLPKDDRAAELEAALIKFVWYARGE